MRGLERDLDAGEGGQECSHRLRGSQWPGTTHADSAAAPETPMAEILEVLKYPDPILRRGGKDVQEVDDAIRATAANMLHTMYNYRGVGLAAPQVGLDLKLLVLNQEGDPAKPEEELVMLNPKIISRKTLEFGEEGCLSFPSLYAEVGHSRRVSRPRRRRSGSEVRGLYRADRPARDGPPAGSVVRGPAVRCRTHPRAQQAPRHGEGIRSPVASGIR